MKMFGKLQSLGSLPSSFKQTRFIDRLRKYQAMVSTAIIISVGSFLFLLGGWILVMQIAGLLDFYQPNSIKIGAMSIDAKDSKSHAELFRARFDHHFRPAGAVPVENGFLEVQSLDLPRIFQQPQNESKFANVSVQVSGVDVSVLYQLVNKIAQQAQWIVEGDFQTMPDRILLALRMRRGGRLIRTWYLEQYDRNIEKNKSVVIERLIDDAIFQLAYDFTNENEDNEDIVKWREVLPKFNVSFPNRQAFANYFIGRSALARYFSTGNWAELSKATDQLRLLRAEMPEYKEGLQLLGLALAESRVESEAIHVYDQLLSLLDKADKVEKGGHSPSLDKWAAQLQKGTARLRLFDWRSTHLAHNELTRLGEVLQEFLNTQCNDSLKSVHSGTQDTARHCVLVYELQAQTHIQLAYCYAIYLAYLKNRMVAEIFGSDNAPDLLRIKNQDDLDVLLSDSREEGDKAKDIVKRVMVQAAELHIARLSAAQTQMERFAANWRVVGLEQGARRLKELRARYHFVAGYGHYRIAELESSEEGAPVIIDESLLGEPGLQEGETAYAARLRHAAKHLKQAEAAHPSHYQALQFLGLVFSEPRREYPDLHIAEQYLERAVMAKPSAYFSRALRAELTLRRISDLGLDANGIELIEKGLVHINKALDLKQTSNSANILLCKYVLLQLEVESDPEKRRKLWRELKSAIGKAERYTPRLFKHISIELDWVKIVAAVGLLEDKIEDVKAEGLSDPGDAKEILEDLANQKDRLVQQIDELINQVEVLEARWVAHQHIFQAEGLKKRAQKLRDLLESTQNLTEFNIELFDSLGRAVARS